MPDHHNAEEADVKEAELFAAPALSIRLFFIIVICTLYLSNN